MAQLITTLGPRNADELGPILPHEHVFVDLRTWDKPGHAQADAADVIALMAPEIERIKAHGFTALVECSTVGVGRRADIDRAVSDYLERDAGLAHMRVPRSRNPAHRISLPSHANNVGTGRFVRTER